MRENSKNVQYIKDVAKKAGFDACGIASPTILEKDSQYLKQWLSENKQGNIKYLEKNIEQKTDIRKLLENTKSVIALIQNYYPEKKQNENTYYKIAKYAWGNDYHTVMKEKANTFIETLQTKYKKAKFKIFVDSNTILEKAWAARCGIGWIGKNTLLINKENGSFLFICIVLTDLELNYNEILEDNCGNCNECIDACPAKAVETPFHLNASKCIAYHTIENHISEENSNTNKWIYGCDICQDVCPWNQHIPFTKEEAFSPNPDILNMTSKQWETLDEKTFNKLFSKSAVKRIGFEKMKNNIKNARE